MRNSTDWGWRHELAGEGRVFDTFSRLQELPASGTTPYGLGAEGRYLARQMTDEECARRVSAIRAEARQRVPEWEPWMTAKVGYAAEGNADARKARRREKDRRRYLRRAADPEEYERFLAKARADQAVRDAAKRVDKSTSGR